MIYALSFHFFNMVNYTNQFSNDRALHSWGEIYLVMIDVSFYMFLDSICYYIFEDFCIHFTGLRSYFLVMLLPVLVLGECL